MKYAISVLEAQKALWTHELFKMREFNNSHFVHETSHRLQFGIGYTEVELSKTQEKIDELQSAIELLEG